jgi:hypothetical protein
MATAASSRGTRKKGKIVVADGQIKEYRNRKGTRVKGKTGILAGLLELPLDILLEVWMNILLTCFQSLTFMHNK